MQAKSPSSLNRRYSSSMATCTNGLYMYDRSFSFVRTYWLRVPPCADACFAGSHTRIEDVRAAPVINRETCSVNSFSFGQI